jgi:SAM-dependent methyltransferase
MSSEICMACGCSRFSIDPTSSERFSLVRCAGCGVAFTNPKPSGADLEKHYSETYYGPENVKFLPVLEKIVDRITKRRARWIDKKIRGHSRVLEIGCGRGLLLKALSHLGHECHGTERSNLAATRAQSIVGVKIYTKPLEQCRLPENYFDVVILWHVLEHLEYPAQTLTHVTNLLRKRGVLIIEVPNLSSWQARLAGKHWFHLDIERHLYHFTAKGLNILLESRGLQIVKMTTFSWEQCPFGALQTFLNCLGVQPQTFC